MNLSPHFYRKRWLIFFLVFVFVGLNTLSAQEAKFEMGHKMTLLVIQLAIIVIAARFIGLLFSQLLHQPRVLGELVAGMVIGPYALGAISLPFLNGPLFPKGPGFLPVSPELYGLAVVASIVLLFMSGLETDLPTFLRFSVVGSVVGLGGVVLSFFLGTLIAVLLLPGVNSFLSPAALFLGALSTATSVGITARILNERRKMSSPEGVTILAGAVLDDVLGIVILAIVVGISRVQIGGSEVEWGHIGTIALKAFGFWVIATALGILSANRLTRGLKRLRSQDAIAGVALGLALFVAGLAEMAGLAMIIGAYIMGLSLSQTDIASELRNRIHGVYNFLVPVFFCVMGMMVNFAAMKRILVFGVIYALLAIIGKVVGCGLPAYLMGFNWRGAFRVGAGMLPRGEVTLIIAGVGLSAGAIGSDLFGVAIVTLLIASLIAPSLLVKSFEGGSGLRKETLLKKEEAGCRIKLEFPSFHIASFIRNRIIEAFENEEFFVHRLNIDGMIYHIKKEDVFITLHQKEGMIELSASEDNRALVSLIVMEEILALKDLFEAVQKVKKPEMVCEELASGLLSDEEEKFN